MAFAVAMVACLAGCDSKNVYAPPPPPDVSVAHPAKQDVTRYLNVTGSAQARQSVDLVARVAGTLQSIDYKDGQFVKKGTRLFLIDPAQYQAQLEQAEASVAQGKATLANAESQYKRQLALGARDVTAQAQVDSARADRDSAQAQLSSSQASVVLAQLNLGYTTITAPFDGVVTAHQSDVGALVGQGGPTTLATIVQLRPINVTFTVSETDVLRLHRMLQDEGKTLSDLEPIPVEAGTQIEQGYPHSGRIDYVAPQVDAQTGTLSARAIFANQKLDMLPGTFARLRIPVATMKSALLVPDTAIGTDQQGRYVLVLGKDDTVQQRSIEIAPGPAGFEVATKGLAESDLVVVGGLERATPDAKVKPTTVTLAVPRTQAVDGDAKTDPSPGSDGN